MYPAFVWTSTKNEWMHRTQFDPARLDFLSLVNLSRLFWLSATGNLRKAQRWCKSVLTFDITSIKRKQDLPNPPLNISDLSWRKFRHFQRNYIVAHTVKNLG